MGNMKRNRQGFLIGDLERECSLCGSLFPITSKMTMCNPCNSKRVTSEAPEVRMWRRAKNRAKERGHEFDIEVSDINIPSVCPVLGMPLVVHSGKSGAYSDSPSLDRIDNSKGYVKGNVRVLSQLANAMKAAATEEQLVKFANWILSTIPATE